MDRMEANKLVGEILADFLKTGPESANHIEEIKFKILKIVDQIVVSPNEATESYIKICDAFFENVVNVRGLPTRKIFSDLTDGSNLISSSGKHIAENFESLLPKVTDCYTWCIENYRRQSQLFFAEQIEQFQALLLELLKQVPVGGTKERLIKSKLSELKTKIRTLSKWSQLFYIYKTTSFSAEIEYIFALEGGAIAAKWHYSQLDEQGEYKKTYGHRERNGCVYAVRGNWAMEKGLMKAEPYGYIDEISPPQQEIGCCCNYAYLYHLRNLPEEMLTAKGKAERQQARKALAVLPGEKATEEGRFEQTCIRPSTQTENEPQKSNIPAGPKTGQSGLRGRLMSWLGRGGL